MSSMAHLDSFWGSAAFRSWKVQSRRRISWKKDKQDLTLAGKRTSHFIAEPVLAFVCICVHACDGWLWFPMLVNGWHSWAIFSATCWLREKRIQTMQSKEHEKDALAKEKIEMLLGDKAELWCVGHLSSVIAVLTHYCRDYRHQSSSSFIEVESQRPHVGNWRICKGSSAFRC